MYAYKNSLELSNLEKRVKMYTEDFLDEVRTDIRKLGGYVCMIMITVIRKQINCKMCYKHLVVN